MIDFTLLLRRDRIACRVKRFVYVRGGNVIDNQDCIDNQHSKFSFSDLDDSTPKSLNFCRGGSEREEERQHGDEA